jgi:hypothetical protein
MSEGLILGDNPFFGVDHRSRKAGEAKARRFEKDEEILRVLRIAKDAGFGGVSFSSYDRIPSIARKIASDPALSENFPVYPTIPYLMKFVQLVTREGFSGAARRVIFGRLSAQRAGAIFSGALAWASKDFLGLFRAGLDLEISLYGRTRRPAVFLHNGITDLLLGLGMDELFLEYDAYIRARQKTEPGYGTVNLPLLVRRLHSLGIKDPLIMAPFNSAGFHMNPSPSECEKTVRSGGFRLMAMNALASGAVKPAEAFEYLARFGIRRVVIGASKEEHIRQCRDLARKHLGI